MEKRDKFTGVNSIKFYKRFLNDDDCYSYLSAIKWEEGYKCKRCSTEKYIKGLKPFSRRCSKCKYDESATSGTMFDKVKIPLLIAFHIVFKVSTKVKGMSSLELSHEFELRQPTCWEFKWKIQQAMQSSKQHPLEGCVEVDEFFIGGPEEQKRGRSKGKKRLVVIALEKVTGGVGRAYAQVIEHASAKEFKPFFHSYIKKNASVVTDEWNGYLPLKKDYPKLKQLPPNKGKGFTDLHIHMALLHEYIISIGIA